MGISVLVNPQVWIKTASLVHTTVQGIGRLAAGVIPWGTRRKSDSTGVFVTGMLWGGKLRRSIGRGKVDWKSGLDRRTFLDRPKGGYRTTRDRTMKLDWPSQFVMSGWSSGYWPWLETQLGGDDGALMVLFIER